MGHVLHHMIDHKLDHMLDHIIIGLMTTALHKSLLLYLQ